ncbi:MAG TPA: MBL fold metallo-hydrolase [Bacillales bacterium]|nr:MBL fold metallo-hydrolase [Bacillales bacterium]
MRLWILFVLALPVLAGNIDHIDLNLESNEIAMTFFNLSEGEAALIQNRKQNILINTGSRSSRQQLFERLHIYGVRQLDAIILTNASAEYTGNLQAVIDKFPVRQLISTKQVLRRLETDDRSTVKHFYWSEGDRKQLLKNLNVSVLYATKPGNEQAAMNLRFQYGSQKVLYMGINDKLSEKNMMKDQAIHCDILKIGNFGREHGILSEFVKKVNPEIAVLFHKNGVQPDEDLLELLENDWVELFAMKEAGNLTVKITPQAYNTIIIPLEEEETW